MHPKLMLLLFPDFLRVSISSANIGAYESAINQAYWVHDIPRRTQTGQHTLGAMPRSSFHSFQIELIDFVQKILTVDPRKPLTEKRNSLPLFDSWGALLEGPELLWNVPSGVHLVASIPGAYVSQADRERYGHMRIRTLLAENLSPMREDSILPKRIELQCSSLGQLRQDFLRSFVKSVSTDSATSTNRSNEDAAILASVRKQMENLRDGKGERLILELTKYQRRECHAIAEELGLEHDSRGQGTSRVLHIFRSPHEDLLHYGGDQAVRSPVATPTVSPTPHRLTSHGGSQSVHSTHSAGSDLRLVWPTFDTVARCVLSVGTSEARSSTPGQLQERAESAAGMTAADDWKENSYPRQIFCDHLPPWPHRQFTLHHSKVIALTIDDDGTGAAVPPEEEHHALCRWVYVGSHNFSTVAWGVNEGASCFRVCSWELGVMIIPARPKRFPLPFTANAKRYQLESGSAPPDRPWGTGAVLERLRGQGDAELAARANVARCIVCFEAIVSAGGSGGSSARGGPTILRQTFGELSSATSRSAAAHASSAGDGQAAAAAGGTDGTLPRICLFLDLRAAANSSCGKHDESVRTLWTAMTQLGGLIDSLFNGVWIGGVDGTMGHSELVARDMGFSGQTAELPCLRVFANRHTLLEMDGPEAISRACSGRSPATALERELREAVERSALVALVGQEEEQERQRKQFKRQTMHLRNAHFIRKRYRVVIFDCEGVLKKPAAKIIQRGHKYDSWCSVTRTCIDCVPFMSQLLLPRNAVDRLGLCPAGTSASPSAAGAAGTTAPSAAAAAAAASNATAATPEEEDDTEKEAPAPVNRRADAPKLCIVSNVGVAQTEIGEDGRASTLRHDGSAQMIISAAMIRLAAELHMLPEYDTAKAAFSAAQNTEPLPTSGEDLASTAETRLGVASRFVSFVRDVRADAAERVRSQHWKTVQQEGEDSFEPCNAKPRGGGILLALKRAGIAPRDALMITSQLPEDREAAVAAGVDWMDARYLFSGKVPADDNIQANRRKGAGSGVQSFGDSDALDVNRKRDTGGIAHPGDDIRGT
jgi:hypothetical protein